MAKKSTTTSNSIYNRIEKLESKMRAVAFKLSLTGELTAEDHFQEMVMKIWEKELLVPGFFNDKNDSYLLQYCKLGGQNLNSKAKTYLMHLNENGQVLEAGFEDELDETDIILKDSKANVEFEVANNILAKAIESKTVALSNENKIIVAMLYEGYQKQEIALALGISNGAISQRIKTIANQLTSVLELA